MKEMPRPRVYIRTNLTQMTDKKYERYYGQASKAAFENWESVKKSNLCGCYYCGCIFPSSEVTDNDWMPDLHGRTVLCPHCSFDSVKKSGCPPRVVKYGKHLR